MLTHVIITLLSFLTHAIAQFQCQGTCYSGSFPKGNDVIAGQHLRGYSYKNISTDVPRVCFSSCFNDCRCNAFQMKDVRCELLDEDKTSKAADFVDGTGYVYYDLQQKLYKGQSHMVQPADVCYNGCCRNQPCHNGGTCVEHCVNSKEKFSCTCNSYYYGKVCEKMRPYNSCMDVLNAYTSAGKMPRNGAYRIARSDNLAFQSFYCAFEGANKAWTLIESFALANKGLYAKKDFLTNFFRNNDFPPNWNDYRLQKNAILYHLRPRSTMFRATCDFPKRESLTPDFLLGYLSECDFINNNQMKGHCIKFAHINIRGYDFYNTTAPVWHLQGTCHFAIDPTGNRCSFSIPESVKSEDNFGAYFVINPRSTCTATQNSTTQWWLGEEK
ncbi:uncharacterized protein LOC116287660 [Actinia tenebrosa]|uniref:Uncharacterized protein LOC116287660 n=1 Tax=Actinia tenebrosa TaxID=6105 RepID=A0A6P8H3P9_ACTTE|nr:uncharacterized protein LOC116287660 [Actinia tenebrosa]XP_031550208.1 uncharacterized protein LOC116287660 [Actinia tenebrosa]